MGKKGLLVLLATIIAFPALPAEVINIHPLFAVPNLDGKGDDWEKVPEVVIPLRPIVADSVVEAREVRIKAGHIADSVYFYLQWVDSEENREHKSYIWNRQKQRYVRGPAREDRCSMQFEMDGEYTTDWLNAEYFKADMWHWKSFRSNPLGIAHDKMTIVSTEPLLRSAQLKRPKGGISYVIRPSDDGVQPYTTKRYRHLQKQTMPKYQLNHEVSGSVADIKAKGRWSDGVWHLELARKLDTGHDDDVKFRLGESVKGGIGIFDGSNTGDHNISDTLIFQF
ncbi:MAG: ethylbenzene dehydrogenase-related protein [Sedimenticola sp.]